MSGDFGVKDEGSEATGHGGSGEKGNNRGRDPEDRRCLVGLVQLE